MTKGQKIERIIDKYDLDGFGEELVARWTDPNDPESLHELENRVNRTIIQNVVENELDGLTPHEYPPDRIAHLLRAANSTASRFENVSMVEITQVRNWLEENKIDTEEISADLVSYNTVYQYLTNIRNADAPDGQREPRTPEELRSNILTRQSKLRQRVESVTQKDFHSLVDASVIPDTFELHIEFRVECTNCARRQDVLEYVRNGGCISCSANV